jgi:hypothetical protein
VSNVTLGPYVNIAREVLWGHRPLTDLPAFRVMVQRYHHAPGINKMYSLPMPTKASVGHHEWYGYVFMLVGFRFMVTLDPRPFPPEYTSYVLNGNTVRVAPSLTSQRPTRLSRCANSPPSTISVRLGPNRLHDDPAGPGGGRVIFLDPGEYRGWRRRGTFTAAGATETAADMTRLFGQPCKFAGNSDPLRGGIRVQSRPL